MDLRKPIPLWIPIAVIALCLFFLAAASISGGVLSW
jgi:hypothetical protein